MALDAATTQQYFRQSQQQQVLYAYWLSAGDTARARLAMDVANWFYQQLGIPYFYPRDFSGYVPNPTDPHTAVALAASLPLVVITPAPAGGRSPGRSGTGSGNLTDAEIQAAAISRLSSAYTSGALDEYCAWYPDDPVCWDSGPDGGGDGGSGPVYIDNPVTIVIDQGGLTLADVASRISGALATAAAAIATAVDTALASAIAGIQHALNALGNELASVWHLLSRLFGYVLQFLKGLLLDVIHGLVAAVQAIGKMLKDVYQNVLMPALKALQSVRDYLIKIYERFLRPLLIMLQDLRKLLAILKIFHVRFAFKLDKVLADVQSKISTPLLYLMRYTNAIANYINLILDARLFIQRPLFLASLNAYKGSAINLQLNAMNPPPDPAALTASQAAGVIPTPAQSADALNQFLTDGTGPYSDQIAQQRAKLQLYITNGV